MGCVFSGRVWRANCLANNDELEGERENTMEQVELGRNSDLDGWNSAGRADKKQPKSLLTRLLKRTRFEKVRVANENSTESHGGKRKTASVAINKVSTTGDEEKQSRPANSQGFLQIPNNRKRRRDSNQCKIVADPTRLDSQLETMGKGGEANSEVSWRSSSGASSSAKSDPSRLSSRSSSGEEVKLFTSVQQLCSQIISDTLLEKSGERVLVLFTFGRQGSNRGELAYELVEHSSLIKFLSSGDLQQSSRLHCPLYHHLDVATIIVTNIDARIREYNRLAAQISRNRKRQLEQTRSVDDVENCINGQFEKEDSQSQISRTTDQVRESNVSICSEISSATIDSSRHQSITNATDEFGLITLGSKQRSILQLKLMKYFNSITSKWLFGLIRGQIDKLEDEFKRVWCKMAQVADNKPEKPARVYLINLVPNQLSIFKSCIYLQQNLCLRDFNYPFWAIKFERQTNIKLLSKERGLEKQSAQQIDGHSSNLRSPLRLVQLRLSQMRNGANSNQPTQLGSGGELRETQERSSDRRREESVSELVANEVCEKLGPKFNDQFVEQFTELKKLIAVRYNPIMDYNYAYKTDNISSSLKNTEAIESCSSFLETKRHQFRSELGWFRSGSEDSSKSGCSNGEMMSLLMKVNSVSMQNLKLDESSQTNLNFNPSKSETSKHEGTDNTSKKSPSITDQLDRSKGTSFPFHSQTRRSSALYPSGPLKWAIELHLTDPIRNETMDTNRASGTNNQTESSLLDWQHWRNANSRSNLSTTIPNANVVFQEPSRGINSIRSRSPLNLVGGGGRQIRGSTSYHLVPVRVSYAKDKSLLMYEVKCSQSRTIKLKSSSDLSRISKLIDRAQNQLMTDCRNWLYESVAKYQQLRSIHRKRHSVSSSNRQGLISSSELQPALIVYTIQIDVSRLNSRQFQYPINFNPPEQRDEDNMKSSDGTRKDYDESNKLQPSIPSPILTINKDCNSLTPSPVGSCSELTDCRLRPASSRLAMSRSQRHVQFRLSQPPDSQNNLDWNDGEKGEPIAVQRREWIGDHLFLSSSSGVTAADGDNTLTICSSLIKFHIYNATSGKETSK